MSLEIKTLLTDIMNSINSIDEFLEFKRDFNQFMGSKLVRRGIEREFEIIGEAMNNLLKLEPEIAISSAKQIISLRNRVIHDYGRVDYIILWRIINKDIPILKNEVKALLNN